MFKRILFSILFIACYLVVIGQEINDQNYRTFSGINNNLTQTDWGATHTYLRSITDVGFLDGYEAPSGDNRPNPRVISNSLFNQDDPIIDPTGLSDFCWVWGQFIDHDIGLTEDGPEYLPIEVPAGDPDFDPFGMGQAIIPMHRNTFSPTTGTDASNPRRYPNEITAFIDGSAVYGSDEERALWLRTLEDGKLKVSEGDFLPFNTFDGSYEDDIDPAAPAMANATGISDKIFVAGDVRASENTLLLSFHTIFVREHNRQCDLLKAKNPDWTDEQIYHYARKIVGGIIQSIMYDEWVPAVGLDMPAYTGYDTNVNPQLSNVFTAAAYRVGHTLLSSTLQRLDENGDVIPQGNLALKDAFFNPITLTELGTLDPYLKGMAVQTQQNMDSKVINDIRNFLFGQPGFGGLDLASININRGRERGLTDYNTIRENVGLNRISFFQQVNSNALVFSRLQNLYLSVNRIDPWVGMLAESPIPGSIFGRTIHTILSDQFRNLRDGDRFYYWNDPVLTSEEKEYIQNITLRDIIMYNTNITLMQDDVFGALPHAEICENMTFDITGLVKTEEEVPVPNVMLSLTSSGDLETLTTPGNGEYTFSEVPFCEIELLIPQRNDDITNGVSTFDIILIQKHILGVDPLDSPYKWIAADVNNSGTVTTIDLIRLRKAILGINTEFQDNTSWRFVLASFEFQEGEDPLSQEFTEFIDFSSENLTAINQGFIAVKIGDVNSSANLIEEIDQLQASTSNNAAEFRDKTKKDIGLSISYPEIDLKAGQSYTMTLHLTPEQNLEGFQFELLLEDVEILKLETELSDQFYAQKENSLRFSWSEINKEAFFTPQSILVHFMALKDKVTSQAFSLSQNFTPEAYNELGDLYNVQLLNEPIEGSFIVKQNYPNPFIEQTQIPFYLSSDDKVTLTITDITGRIVFKSSNEYEKGWHNWLVHKSELSAKGVFRYKMESTTETIIRSMIIQ